MDGASFKTILEKVGKSPTKNPRHDIRKLPNRNKRFDEKEKPVIAIDNVEFHYTQNDRHADQQRDFFSFVLSMKDAAHAAGIVVALATKNFALCKELSVLNGFRKICPAET